MHIGVFAQLGYPVVLGSAILGCASRNDVRPLPVDRPETWTAPAPPEKNVALAAPARASCDEEFADRLAAARASVAAAVEQQKADIARNCVPVAARDAEISPAGVQRHGATRTGWLCNGQPVNSLPGPVGNGAVAQVLFELSKCKNDRER